jgi:hypothetical protein
MGDLLIATIISALAVAFVISAIDTLTDVGRWRGLLALLLSIPAILLLNERGVCAGISSMASAFLSLAITFLLENRVTYLPNRRM